MASLLLFLISCEQKDEPEFFDVENKTLTDIKRIKQQFEEVNLPDPFLQEAFKVKWNQFEVTENSDESLTYEFATNLRTKLDLVNADLVKTNNTKKILSAYKLLVKESPEGTLSFEILKFTGNNSKELMDIRLTDLSDFNGAVNYTTPEGVFVKDEIYSEGSLVKTIHQRPDPSWLAKEPPVDDGFVYVREMMIIDHYNVCLSCGGGITNPENWYYRSTSYTPVWTLVPRSTGAQYGQIVHSHSDEPSFAQIHGAGSYSDNHPVEIFPLPDFKANDKLNCTFIQLSKVTRIQELLKGFMGKLEDPDAYHINMDLLPNPNCDGDHSNACTFGTFDPADKFVTIKFDSDYVNDPEVPTISIARTLIHESIHAALFLEVKQWNAGVTPETPYNVLLDDYRNRKIGSSHPIMSKNYINDIVNILREVNGLLGQDQRAIDYLNSTPGFNWDEFYLFLAYQGLDDTPEYDAYRSTRSDEFLNMYKYKGIANSTTSPNCN